MRVKSAILPIGLLALAIALCAAALLPAQSAARSAAAHDLAAVWARVQKAGAYHFRADVEQIKTPQATMMNAGRSPSRSTLYLEGETDLNAHTLNLRLWSESGAVQLPETGVEVQVDGDHARARAGAGPWEDVEDFTDLFAPDGDFLSYSQAGADVVRHAPEVRPVPGGNVLVTRYSYAIDGALFAARMADELRARSIRDGLPSTVSLDVSEVYAGMHGQGELWVGADGLPLRQQFTLHFPPDEYDYATSAEVTVTFSDFRGTPVATAPGMFAHLTVLRALAGHLGYAAPNLAAIVLALFFTGTLIARRRARWAYGAVSVVVLFSMVLTPLLTNQRVYAYSADLAAQHRDRQQQQADAEATRAQLQQVAMVNATPHAAPLEVAAQKQSASAALPAPLAQSDTGSQYYDDSCADDPDGDLDGDTLTNLSECLLGTLPSATDSDRDGADDNLEVVGFLYAGQMWYSDPLRTDSNNDGLADGKEWHMDADGNGLPDDTDGDGTPDLWDDDNDGDGVQDSLDLSPYMSTGPGATSPKIFNSDSPLQITLNDLVVSELTRVEFQVIPGDADHLRLTRMVFDWPENDKQGQIQDADGTTFYDMDTSVDPSPNANGDMRLLPALEITMPADSANLPPSTTCTRDDGSTYTCYPILEDFNISVRQVTTGTLAAYVPLQLVADSTGDNAEAFYGRMYYQAASTWGDAHDVRFVWMVQVLNDVCEEYEDNLCSAYSAYNDEQIIHTYPEADWFLSGLHVTEEHEADIALIYEDPTAAANLSGAPANYDKPLYVDALYGLLYGLDSSFLVGRCDEVDSSGKCTDTAQRDMTVDTIGDRFNHATNSGVSSDERWNLPNILSVTKNGVTRAPGDGYADYAAIPSYASIDLGMLDTTVTQTVTLLDNVFTPVWSATAPVTPTIMLASEQTYRDLNLDASHVGDDAIQWTGDQALTLDWNGIGTDTLASLKWTPYAYDPSDGWAATDLGGYIDDLNLYLAGTLDPDDPSASVMDNMNQLLYSAIFTGNAQIVEIDGEPVEAEGEEEDESIAEELITEIGKMSKEVIVLVIEYDETVEEISKALDELESEGYTYTSDTARWVIQYALLKSQGVGLGVYVFDIVLLVLDVTALILNNLLQNSPGLEKFNEGLEYTTLVVKAVKKTQQIWQATETIARYSETAEAASETEAVAETLSESATILNLSQVLAGIGFILTLGAAIGTLIYLASSNDIPAGSPEYTLAVLTTIVSLVLTVTLTVLAIIDPVGAILVAVIGLVDTILKAIGAQWSVFGELATQLTAFVYNYKSIQSISASTGSVGIDYADPDLGLVGDSTVTFSLPITTTYAPKDNCLTVPEDYQETFVRYTLAGETQDLDTIYNEGNWNGWRNRTAFDVPAYTQVLESGINREIPLVVNSVSYTAGQNEWWFIIVGTCNLAHNWSTAHVEFGDAYVLDILPPTIDEFLNFSAWSEESLAIRNIDADGDGLLATEYGGVDPDDTQWDLDGDTLSDGYELTVRSLASDQGGVALDVRLADSDSDGIRDDRELDWGMNPGVRDTDGDGLYDLEEIAPEGGWTLTYAYDAATATSTTTRIWSDPVRADADGDGMNDLFEQDQNTIQLDPWADPTDPRIFNPSVWNESPVALYVDDTSNAGFVKPGATVVYSTTTINNLSSGQSLAGALNLSLPQGVTGSPLSQVVDIDTGASDSLVSNLTFPNSGSSAYALTSGMQLTDYDQTRWSWDLARATTSNAVNGTARNVAVTPVDDWNTPYLVAALEQATNGHESVTLYAVESDGLVAQSVSLLLPQSNATITGPAIACNNDGVCLVIWGENSTGANQGYITGVRLNGSASSLTTISPFAQGEDVGTPALDTDGTNFMAAWTADSNNGANTLVKVATLTAAGSAGSPQEAAQLTGAQGAAALAWSGDAYTLIWTGDGNIHRALVSTSGAVSAKTVVGAGAGWPQSDGSLRAPAVAYDTISGQVLVAYRTDAGEVGARRLAGSIGDEFLVTDDVAATDAVVALSDDAKNSGWVVAWTPSDGTEVAYRAVSPSGTLRGARAAVDQSVLATLTLACVRPGSLLTLAFEESADATTFADSSGNGNDATCYKGNCPQAGVSGIFGKAVSFDGSNDALLVPGEIARRSFTVAAWVKRSETAAYQMLVSQGEESYMARGKAFVFGFDDQDHLYCNFWDDTPTISTQGYSDGLWHHYACTYDATTKLRTIYRDGQVIAKSKAGVTYSGAGDFMIGANIITAGAFLAGDMDNLLVVDRAMSASELNDVFDNPLAAYDLDEAAGSTRFINAAPNGFDGACSGAACPQMGVAGVAYTAAQFDGAQGIEITGATGLPLANSSFTVSSWVKRSKKDVNEIIFSQGVSNTTNQQLHIGFRNSNEFTCAFWNDDLNTAHSYTDTDWHHWVCTYDASTRQRVIYRDGVAVAQNTAQADFAGTGLAYIGKRSDNNWHFTGAIDEVGIWPIALNADQVSDLYAKVKVEDESVLTCQLPVATTAGAFDFTNLTLRETTTQLGEISQTLVTTITVDADNPTAQVEATAFSQTAPGSYTTSSGVLVIGGAAADATSFIDLVEVNDGNGWMSANGSASWSYNWDTSGLADGAQQVQLRATDAVGNVSATTTWHTLLDTTGPDLTIDPPGAPVHPDRDSNGQWRVPVTGTAVDPAAGSQPGSGVATVQVLFQGQEGRQGQGWQTATLSGDGTWQVDYLVPKFGNGGKPFAGPTGLYTITVRAFDAVGNLSSSAQTPNRPVTLDGTPPQVTADATFSATAVITTAMTLSGMVEDDQAVAAVDVSFIPGAQAAALDGAVLHLPMDDVQAQEYFDDQSGFGNDAVCTAGACPEPASTGARGGGFAFSGEDTLTVSGLALAATSFTLSVWAKRNAANVAEMILSQGETTNTNQQLHLGFRSDNGYVCGFFGDDLVTPQSATDTEWHHWACTYDDATRRRILYRDGIEVARDTATGSYAGAGPLYIGKRADDSMYFQGIIDEVVVHDRVLAAYEVANLYAYGLGTWQQAQVADGRWEYALSAGDDGLEGIFQMNVRGTDGGGNMTPFSAQQVWRGLIDTKPPTLSAPVTVTTAGSLTTTTFGCEATDFSLDNDTSCVAQTDAPEFRNGDRTLTLYGDVNPWYAATFADTAQLYAIDAVRTYTEEVSATVELTACDAYDHCTSVTSQTTPAQLEPFAATLLSPPSGTVLTTQTPTASPQQPADSPAPVQVTGHAYAQAGVVGLVVRINDRIVYEQVWQEDEPVDETWSFVWTPPGAGSYTLEAAMYDLSDWYPLPAAQQSDERADGNAPAIAHELPVQIYLPQVVISDPNRRGLQYLPFVRRAFDESGRVARSTSRIYVDLAEPTVSISTNTVTLRDALSNRSPRFTGTVDDDSEAYAVEVSVNGSDWRRATVREDGTWYRTWGFPQPLQGETVDVSVRVTDIAGRIVTTSARVLVDLTQGSSVE